MQIPYQLTLTALIGLVVGSTLFVSRLYPTLGPNLALNAAVTVSSRLPDTPEPQHLVNREYGEMGFHTLMEDQPWVILDLRRVQTISRIIVYNRHNCCKERAIPLDMAVSRDGREFKSIAQQRQLFERWDQKFPPRPVRFIRLQLMRRDVLHLNEVEVYQ